MKRSSTTVKYKLYGLSLLTLFFICIQQTMAQDQEVPRRTRQRPSAVDSSSVFKLTERTKIKNEIESKKPSHIVWERTIYRNIDLTGNSNNAALYYPVQPQNGRQNLFTLIFKLLAEGKITAYNYLEWETFDDSQKYNFETFLTKEQLAYTQQGNRFVVDERDIPSMEVTQYLIKEAYCFDQATGIFQTRVIALCPILVREDYYSGGLSREALFWLNYDDLRPYLARETIMTSNYNNVLTYTMEDYFRKTMYSGEIVKTVNLMGKSLAQEVGSDSLALKQAQDSIEAQLKAFEENLWVLHNDSIHLSGGKEENTKAEKTKPVSGRNASAPKEKARKEPKVQSAPKQNSAPVRSVRRSR